MIAIIGRGNVATHLFRAFKNKEETCLVNPHTLEGLPADADLTLICVSDNAIGEVVKKLPSSLPLVAHTSGSIPISVLGDKFKNYGVFYPLQTFTKDVELNYKEIPVFVEGDSEKTVEKIKHFASAFSHNIFEADSEKRRKLHLASVFACNFTNALAGIAQNILKEAAIDKTVINPLMRQTLKKLDYMDAGAAQTGPAKRKDDIVINSHLQMLKDHPDLMQIYKSISDLIREQ